MGSSSICKQPAAPDAGGAARLSASLDPAVRSALGRTIRRHRLERSLTQGALGDPLSRAYVSSVEAGRVIPSLPALRLMVLRLDLTLGEFFAEVESDLSKRT
jgi:hypothetical protein